MSRSVDVSDDLGYRVYERGEAAQRLNMSLRTLERRIESGTLGHIRHRGRIYVSEDQIHEYEARATRYEQPPIPGLEAAADFTEAQGAAVARVIDANRERRAQARLRHGEREQRETVRRKRRNGDVA